MGGRAPAPHRRATDPGRAALAVPADLARTWKAWLRGPFIGFPFGAIPAGGAEIPTFLSYVTERRLSKHPEEFGSGAIEGVAGPESAASASSAGTLATMLTLGLPTTAIAAVMLAAFQQFGIQPGPLLFENEPELVWTLIASLFIGLVLLLVLNLPLAPLWARLLQIPRPYLYAGILFFACVGAYAVSGQPVDLVVLLAIGAIGFLMRRYGLPGAAGDHRGDPRAGRRAAAAAGAADRQRRLDDAGLHPARGDHLPGDPGAPAAAGDPGPAAPPAERRPGPDPDRSEPAGAGRSAQS